jgi:2-oxoisovalerate dehydrogenase E2 component (dihydrolipoyl transacylase)
VIEVDEELLDSGSAEQIEPASSAAPAPSPMIPNSKFVEDAAPRAEQISEELSAPRRLHPMDPNYLPPSTPNVNPENVLAKPSVRHYARQSKVDLSCLLSGSGRDGRIEKKDVDAFLSQQASSVSVDSGSAAPRAQAEQDVIVELGRTRYGMWKAMTQSLEIPHFGYDSVLSNIIRYHLSFVSATRLPSTLHLSILSSQLSIRIYLNILILPDHHHSRLTLPLCILRHLFLPYQKALNSPVLHTSPYS